MNDSPVNCLKCFNPTIPKLLVKSVLSPGAYSVFAPGFLSTLREILLPANIPNIDSLPY